MIAFSHAEINVAKEILRILVRENAAFDPKLRRYIVCNKVVTESVMETIGDMIEISNESIVQAWALDEEEQRNKWSDHLYDDKELYEHDSIID